MTEHIIAEEIINLAKKQFTELPTDVQLTLTKSSWLTGWCAGMIFKSKQQPILQYINKLEEEIKRWTRYSHAAKEVANLLLPQLQAQQSKIIELNAEIDRLRAIMKIYAPALFENLKQQTHE